MTTPTFYKLVGKETVPCDDAEEWLKAFSEARIVRQDTVGDIW